MHKTVKIGILLIFSSLAVSKEAMAYIDPGTGSLLLQALAAAVISVGIFWRRIVGFFKKSGNERQSDNGSDK